jgi:hypothetical protein
MKVRDDRDIHLYPRGKGRFTQDPEFFTGDRAVGQWVRVGGESQMAMKQFYATGELSIQYIYIYVLYR